MSSNRQVSSLEEKPGDEIGWINGGFFGLEPGVIRYIDGDDTSWERATLSNIAKDGQLAAFHHTGFSRSCDTLRDNRELEVLWASGKAPSRIWADA